MAKVKAIVTFDSQNCKGCGLCVSVCPKHLLELDRKNINKLGYTPARITNMDECVACASCCTMCPDSIITIEKETAGGN